MGCVRKRGKSWNAQVRVSGWRSFTKSFSKKSDAISWINELEHKLRSAPLPDVIIDTKVTMGELLLKKEFDACRETQTPHRLFLENGLAHLVPFQHPDMDKWRDSLRHGLMTRFADTNIILTGGVDDIWQNTETGKLVVADYKSQANTKELEPDSYLSDPYKEGYKVQMDFYAYLLQQMGFEVEDTAYFLVCNADREAEGFNGEMKFQEVLIPYRWNSDWIHDKATEMIDLLNNKNAPDANPSCKNCAYARQRAVAETK